MNFSESSNLLQDRLKNQQKYFMRFPNSLYKPVFLAQACFRTPRTKTKTKTCFSLFQLVFVLKTSKNTTKTSKNTAQTQQKQKQAKTQ